MKMSKEKILDRIAEVEKLLWDLQEEVDELKAEVDELKAKVDELKDEVATK